MVELEEGGVARAEKEGIRVEKIYTEEETLIREMEKSVAEGEVKRNKSKKKR